MNHKPLPAIKSVRRKNFTVSISSGNSKLNITSEDIDTPILED